MTQRTSTSKGGGFTGAIALGLLIAFLAVLSVPAFSGNGAPSGSHYTLNIIGVSKGKNPNMDSASGHVIFVSLGAKNVPVTTKIMLEQAATGVFGVLDKNGTDGEASFTLPAPGSYEVYARALGKPGGEAKMTTCAEDINFDPNLDDNQAGDICSTQNEVFVRGTGKSSFRNVTQALTTIQLVAGSDAANFCGSTSVNLFDPCLEDYFWKYDNQGLKILQIRFYPS